MSMTKSEAIERIKNLEKINKNIIPVAIDSKNISYGYRGHESDRANIYNVGYINALTEAFNITPEDIHPPKQTKLEILNEHGIWEESICWTKEQLDERERKGKIKIYPHSENIFVVKWNDNAVSVYREVKE